MSIKTGQFIKLYKIRGNHLRQSDNKDDFSLQASESILEHSRTFMVGILSLSC